MSDNIYIPADASAELVIETQADPETEIDPSEGGAVILDYRQLKNKPQIEGNILEGNKTFEELGLSDLTNVEIQEILNSLE